MIWRGVQRLVRGTPHDDWSLLQMMTDSPPYMMTGPPPPMMTGPPPPYDDWTPPSNEDEITLSHDDWAMLVVQRLVRSEELYYAMTRIFGLLRSLLLLYNPRN